MTRCGSLQRGWEGREGAEENPERMDLAFFYGHLGDLVGGRHAGSGGHGGMG